MNRQRRFQKPQVHKIEGSDIFHQKGGGVGSKIGSVLKVKGYHFSLN